MQVELEQDLEKYSIKDDPSVALEYAISKIEDVSAFNTHFTECDKQENCTRDTREVVVRLKMIEWGIYGMGEATAGTYLAYFYSKLGPYFGNDDPEKTNKWPHIGLINGRLLLANYDRMFMTTFNFQDKLGRMAASEINIKDTFDI